MKIVPTKNNPGFGIITPVAYLDQYASQSHFHLVLAHLVDTNDEYAAFYAKMSTWGDFVICDNGAFELGESYDPDSLVRLGHKCAADVIVLPDYPLQPYQKTIDASSALIDVVKQEGFKTFFAPQSETGDLEGWIKGYQWASENDDIDVIGMSILGIPNALPHIPRAYARVVMTQLLVDRGVFNFNKYHHYLGSNAGMGLEVPALVKMKALDSCDSSNPVWHAILGHEYSLNTDSLLPVRKVHMPVQFDYPMTTDKETLRRIQTNIYLSMRMFIPPI